MAVATLENRLDNIGSDDAHVAVPALVEALNSVDTLKHPDSETWEQRLYARLWQADKEASASVLELKEGNIQANSVMAVARHAKIETVVGFVRVLGDYIEQSKINVTRACNYLSNISEAVLERVRAECPPGGSLSLVHEVVVAINKIPQHDVRIAELLKREEKAKTKTGIGFLENYITSGDIVNISNRGTRLKAIRYTLESTESGGATYNRAAELMLKESSTSCDSKILTAKLQDDFYLGLRRIANEGIKPENHDSDYLPNKVIPRLLETCGIVGVVALACDKDAKQEVRNAAIKSVVGLSFFTPYDKISQRDIKVLQYYALEQIAGNAGYETAKDALNVIHTSCCISGDRELKLQALLGAGNTIVRGKRLQRKERDNLVEMVVHKMHNILNDYGTETEMKLKHTKLGLDCYEFMATYGEKSFVYAAIKQLDCGIMKRLSLSVKRFL